MTLRSHQTERMRGLVDQLLDLSRLEAENVPIHPVRIPVRAEIEELVAASAGGRTDEIEVQIPEGLEALVDRTVFERVVSNLLTNALRHGHAPVVVTATQSDNHFRLAVEDSGEGVPPRFIDDLFERFSRSDEARAPRPWLRAGARDRPLLRARTRRRPRPRARAAAWGALRARRPRRPRPERQLTWVCVFARCREPRRAADAPTGRRHPHGAQARLSPSSRPEGRSGRARGCDRGRQGARPLLLGVRQPDRGRSLRDLPRRAARPCARLRRRAARRPDLGRAHSRVPRALPRARRRALADRRRRAGAPADRRADEPRRAERHRGGRAGDEPEHDRGGDRRLSRRPAPRPGSRDAPRERAARRRRPRVRRRSDLSVAL